MNSICEICDDIWDEGHVCHKCRQVFRPLAENQSEFDMCVVCNTCDTYWFPCRECAKYAFEYRLGPGNGPLRDDRENGSDEKSWTLEQMLDKVSQNGNNKKSENHDSGTHDQKITIIEYDESEITTPVKQKKNSMYYCLIQ